MTNAAALNDIQFTLDPSLRVKNPIVALGLQCWLDARGDSGSLPSRQAFDPTQAPPNLLPHVMLIDVVGASRPRLRWRLVGTHITQNLGRDATGQWWDELYTPEILEAVETGPRWVIANRRPVRTLGNAPRRERAFLHSENVDLPLSSDGKTVDMVMVISVYDPVLGD